MRAAFCCLMQRLDLVLHFVQRLQVRVLLVFDANDVEAVAALTRSLAAPLASEKAAFSNSGRCGRGRSSPVPPFFPLPGSSEYFFARSSKFRAAFNCFRTSSAFLRASSTPF